MQNVASGPSITLHRWPAGDLGALTQLSFLHFHDEHEPVERIDEGIMHGSLLNDVSLDKLPNDLLEKKIEPSLPSGPDGLDRSIVVSSSPQGIDCPVKLKSRLDTPLSDRIVG